MKNVIYVMGALLILLGACGSPEKIEVTVNPDIIPASVGFNFDASDSAAVALADSVAIHAGGKRALDTANFIHFNFFGARDIYWDRINDIVKIVSKRTDFKAIYNLKSDTGKIFVNGELQSDLDSLKKYKDVARAIWINDTYWLLFPYKLKDSGVTLKYVGLGQDKADNASHILQLTFQDVGETPENKYLAYVNADSYRITQWDYFANATDSVPAIVTPWLDYKNYNGLWLSADRGKYKIPFIEVYSELDTATYNAIYKTF
ncbi:hypothetical protein [Luteibaculum oceani]|uniref:DUF4397 domain-containing protein n=1 Tax=Luteibaculum oceani TaxID=1294296 RepID=A0A5C6V9N9_9FLAO|nr:hypothetical protein [Luteibaculum oceani]TXC81490.1 hypothetical protein FRX97_05650 [Luteibaculum oceani]